jgi:hypothetical protein
VLEVRGVEHPGDSSTTWGAMVVLQERVEVAHPPFPLRWNRFAVDLVSCQPEWPARDTWGSDRGALAVEVWGERPGG